MKIENGGHEKLLIIGASGHGKVVLDIALKLNRWRKIFFLDDNESIKSTMGIDVIGKSRDALKNINDYDIFIAIGNNEAREKIQMQLEKAGASIPTLVHPNVVLGQNVELGVGTVIMAGVVINSNSKIRRGCIVNTGATIDHDNIIESFVHISPGTHLAGGVSIGEKAWLGTGVVVINNKKIIRECLVGAGAVVVKDINEAGVYVGIPAKPINKCIASSSREG
ncbi:acetyltransferase [Clostridium cibarium]|uniref:Acetyltransferase n=1 Tax=Clostridium cibarium TaxID=2762247 RepID=A0ABR8PYR7_9CLOT|nr:acetyltransferase [Clostridium cibarium]MBD7913305.1 acetyltransferase [Clostridium cibarium]